MYLVSPAGFRWKADLFSILLAWISFYPKISFFLFIQILQILLLLIWLFTNLSYYDLEVGSSLNITTHLKL